LCSCPWVVVSYLLMMLLLKTQQDQLQRLEENEMKYPRL
jgi:hypothetical protein